MFYPWALALLVLEGWYAALFLIYLVLWVEHYMIAEWSSLTPLQMRNSLYFGLKLLPFKWAERNEPVSAFENSFYKLQGLLAASGCIIFYSYQHYEYIGKYIPPAELC